MLLSTQVLHINCKRKEHAVYSYRVPLRGLVRLLPKGLCLQSTCRQLQSMPLRVAMCWPWHTGQSSLHTTSTTLWRAWSFMFVFLPMQSLPVYQQTTMHYTLACLVIHVFGLSAHAVSASLPADIGRCMHTVFAKNTRRDRARCMLLEFIYSSVQLTLCTHAFAERNHPVCT